MPSDPGGTAPSPDSGSSSACRPVLRPGPQARRKHLAVPGAQHRACRRLHPHALGLLAGHGCRPARGPRSRGVPGLAPGDSVTLPGCLVVRFGPGGLCAALREYWNAGFGLSPPPGIGHGERVGVRAELPGFVTHYYLAGRRPFLSLSELGDAELAAVLADLAALRRAGKQHRPPFRSTRSDADASLADRSTNSSPLHKTPDQSRCPSFGP